MDKLVLAIAERFAHYEMRVHLSLLRAYYAQRRRRKRKDAAGKQPPPWDEDMVLSWAALWRIPPLDNVYPRLEKGARCPCGKSDDTAQSTHTEGVFPEGHLSCCRACGTTWLVITRDAS